MSTENKPQRWVVTATVSVIVEAPDRGAAVERAETYLESGDYVIDVEDLDTSHTIQPDLGSDAALWVEPYLRADEDGNPLPEATLVGAPEGVIEHIDEELTTADGFLNPHGDYGTLVGTDDGPRIWLDTWECPDDVAEVLWPDVKPKDLKVYDVHTSEPANRGPLLELLRTGADFFEFAGAVQNLGNDPTEIHYYLLFQQECVGGGGPSTVNYFRDRYVGRAHDVEGCRRLAYVLGIAEAMGPKIGDFVDWKAYLEDRFIAAEVPEAYGGGWVYFMRE